MTRRLMRGTANRLCAAPRITRAPCLLPPPDPVKDKNQLPTHPPSPIALLKAHRLSRRLFNPNPVALARPVARGLQVRAPRHPPLVHLHDRAAPGSSPLVPAQCRRSHHWDPGSCVDREGTYVGQKGGGGVAHSLCAFSASP